MIQKMKFLFLMIPIYLLHNASGDNSLCGNTSLVKTRSCSTQIIGQEYGDPEPCRVEHFPPNSTICKDMSFGPITSNTQIGGVSLKPYILRYNHVQYNRQENLTVLNITFSNIKWKNMKFRFQKHKDLRNHCRNINIARNVTINDQSVLYYDCYWSMADFSGQSHILDFEATDDNQVVNRGQYYFDIPSASMLSPTLTVEEWTPFIYIEIHTSTMKLHILPPPPHLKVSSYRIQVMKECDKPCEEIVKNSTINLRNSTHEVVYDYSLLRCPGSYYFVVMPLHDKCLKHESRCQRVESPRITITNEAHQTLNICIASVTALIVATLFAYYIVLRVIRRYWCKDSIYSLAIRNEIPPPPKILVIYSPVNKLHAECVSSFVTYLRSEYGFEMMYDGDISSTSHGDPYIWAEEAYRIATHVMYIVSPAEEVNQCNIYDQPIISAHKDVDAVLLSFIKVNRASKSRKDVVNVLFEHSDGLLPIETRHDKKFHLLKDWQKMIAYLSKNLLTKQQLMRTDKGKCFLEDLKRAKKLLNSKQDDVVIKCENVKTTSPFEKYVLL